MYDEKLKIVLAVLSGIIFSLIFILFAFVLPLHDKPKHASPSLNTQLQKISKKIRDANQ